MKAYKCDRCGKFFDHLARDVDKIFVTSSCISNMDIKDLCDECQNELEAWWKIQGTDKKEEESEAKWIDIAIGRYIVFHRCPKCSHYFDTASNYCPNCGKKMEVTNDR